MKVLAVSNSNQSFLGNYSTNSKAGHIIYEHLNNVPEDFTNQSYDEYVNLKKEIEKSKYDVSVILDEATNFVVKVSSNKDGQIFELSRHKKELKNPIDFISKVFHTISYHR